MTREEAKQNKEAILFFANDGNLWCYDYPFDRWLKQTNLHANHKVYPICNIIEDQYFEARKAFALNKSIEIRCRHSEWRLCEHPTWMITCEYRLRPKEPVYEWQWYTVNADKTICLTLHHCVEKDINSKIWSKFEPSKRLRR